MATETVTPAPFVAPAAGMASRPSIDPFNFPMPGRKDLMSLSTVNADRDAMKTTTSKFYTRRGLSQNLTVGDILGKFPFMVNLLTITLYVGAVPKLHGNKVVQNAKAQWNLSNADIERSNPRQLHFGLKNKPDNQMKVDDIKWAVPQCVKFTTKRSAENPLNPKYHLQHVEF